LSEKLSAGGDVRIVRRTTKRIFDGKNVLRLEPATKAHKECHMTQQELMQKWMKAYDVVIGEDVETKDETEFSKLLDATETKQFAEGEVFKGKVISIGPDFVMVDIGYKQEGLVATREFQNFDGTLKIKEGE